jgi:NADH dehydrogenase FAD-containing subunit
VGLELAGEIKAKWPGKTVSIVDPADDILSGGFSAEFRAELRRQLHALGVELVLGTSLREDPPSRAGEHRPVTLTTRSGRRIATDLWFRCHGVAPISEYLAGELATARRATGHVAVTAELSLPGHDHVFAVGDLTALREAKMAGAAAQHAEVVAANIRARIKGGGERATYEPGPPGISLPLGPTGGASYAPHLGVLDAERTAQLKSTDLKLGLYLGLLGLEGSE